MKYCIGLATCIGVQLNTLAAGRCRCNSSRSACGEVLHDQVFKAASSGRKNEYYSLITTHCASQDFEGRELTDLVGAPSRGYLPTEIRLPALLWRVVQRYLAAVK